MRQLKYKHMIIVIIDITINLNVQTLLVTKLRKTEGCV